MFAGERQAVPGGSAPREELPCPQEAGRPLTNSAAVAGGTDEFSAGGGLRVYVRNHSFA